MAAGLISLEGLASIVYLSREVRRPIAERVHTRYDELLGWVNEPNLNVPDMYGKGVWFRTNNQGFRNDRDFAQAIAPGRRRIICSGDSFTLGYGVDNDHTWCRLLETIDSRLETVNMGQGGYGVDQSYLWYKRDGLKLDHDLHLLAFTSVDFNRMQTVTLLGYGKPILKLSGAGLVTDNLPVPRRSTVTPWITENLELLDQLRVVQLVRAVRGGKETSAESPEAGEYPLREVTARLFRDLHDTARSRGATFVLVYLPFLKDFEHPAGVETLRAWISEEASRQGIAFIDLTGEFAALPKEDYTKFFIPRGALAYPHSAGHYNDAGNRFVAEKIYARLGSISETGALLTPRAARRAARAAVEAARPRD
jgi:GDSL-like Lipase/Acylhydrolase family